MRYLIAVRDHGSFAKAAQVLEISQPSLSATISRLEDRLQLKLFERSAAGSSITPVGEFIADRASLVIAEVDRIIRAAALVSGGNIGTIRLGVASSLKDNLTPQLVTDLTSAKPGLNLSLNVDNADVLPNLLRAREIDIAICAVIPEFVEDLVVTELFSARTFALASPAHPLAQERAISHQRLLEFPIAGPRIKGAVRSLRRSEQGESIPRYEANDYDALIPLALAGTATLLAPSFVVRPYVERGDLVALDLELPRVTYAAITNEVNSFSPIVREIIRLALAASNALFAEA